jgi:AraC-like DNA-binding protein
MRRSEELLRSSYLRVKEVMYRVGINDKSHFSRAFKSEFGISPTKYRRDIGRTVPKRLERRGQ